MIEPGKPITNMKEVLVTMTVRCSYGCGASFIGKYAPGNLSQQRIISRSLQADKINHEIDCDMNPKNISNPI